MALTDRLRPWAPAAAWCVVILVATSVPLPADDLPGTELPLDLAGHGVLYAGLGWSLGRGLVRSGRAGPAAGLAVWAWGLAFAALDEWHQAFLPTRVPSAGDWTADAVGLTLGLAAMAATGRLGPGTAGRGGRKRSTRTGSAAGAHEGAGAGEERRGDGADRGTTGTDTTRQEGSLQR